MKKALVLAFILVSLGAFIPQSALAGDVSETAYAVTVNYNLSLSEMVRAGKYDWVNTNITAGHFPAKFEGTKDVVFELVHFDRFIESDEAIRELDRKGLRPATIEELLAFGAKYQEVQRVFSVVALGSSWRHLAGGRDVPYLWGNFGERGLNLDWFEGGWGGVCRFLAVRK